MSRGGAILASLLVTIGRPAWWLLALAGFLVRGGFIVFILPIVLLPSPLAISNMVSPLVVPIALGRIGPDAIAVAVGAFVLVLGVASRRRLVRCDNGPRVHPGGGGRRRRGGSRVAATWVTRRH